MYYFPQTSLLPAEYNVEAWATERAVEQIKIDDERPYFGFVSFIGPHPPCRPPIPYNRMYNPDIIPNPLKGKIESDHMDEQIPFMNYLIWADDINDFQARALKARYYGEISYIDNCIGKILDEVESSSDSENTLICFYSDHGDHLGDHHAWQKESFFEASCKIPFLVSWSKKLKADMKCNELVCLTDLFAIAIGAAGTTEIRDGIDLLGMIQETKEPRKYLFGYYGTPGTRLFKIMVRDKKWKYIYFANGRRQQLFDLENDSYELEEVSTKYIDTTERLRQAAIMKIKSNKVLLDALDNGNLKGFDFIERERIRIHQFANDLGVTDFKVTFK